MMSPRDTGLWVSIIHGWLVKQPRAMVVSNGLSATGGQRDTAVSTGNDGHVAPAGCVASDLDHPSSSSWPRQLGGIKLANPISVRKCHHARAYSVPQQSVPCQPPPSRT